MHESYPVKSAESSASGYAAAARDGVVGLVDKVESMHLAIADQPFRALRATPVTQLPSALVRRSHRGIARGVYSVVRQSLAGLLTLADAYESGWREIHGGREKPSGWWHSALNGLVGDYLHQRDSHLAQDMQCLVPAERSGRHLVVFVHGLCCDENYWHSMSERHWGERDMHYARRMTERGYTPIYIRYNSGLSLSDNGRALNDALQNLHQQWPEPIESLHLVGHSMGGLLSRSAVHVAAAQRSRWVSVLERVVCLGSPHQGSAVERGAELARQALHWHPITRPVAEVVGLRSTGIQNLSDSHLGEAMDWPEHVALDYVFASVAPDEASTVSQSLGDFLVDVGSGSASEDVRYAEHRRAGRYFLGGLNHMQLLNHPRVATVLESLIPIRDTSKRKN